MGKILGVSAPKNQAQNQWAIKIEKLLLGYFDRLDALPKDTRFPYWYLEPRLADDLRQDFEKQALHLLVSRNKRTPIKIVRAAEREIKLTLGDRDALYREMMTKLEKRRQEIGLSALQE